MVYFSKWRITLFEDLLVGMSMVFRLPNLLSVSVGIVVGLAMGAIPGLSDATAISVLLPFTFYLEPIPAICMLVGISKGTNFGGAIPAILFNVPGTGQAAITAIDGYELTKKGKSGKALKMALYASTMGDLMSDFVLLFFIGPIAAIALRVGPPEYSMLILFSMIVIAVASTDNNISKGMISIAFGILLTIIGLDPLTGKPRFIFGSTQLKAGLALIPVVLGLLVIPEFFRQIESILKEKKYLNKINRNKIKNNKNIINNNVSYAEFKICLPEILRGFFIGSIIGAIPGIGTSVAAYLNYLFAKRSSKHPEYFGKGALEGVAASESGNSAVTGPNLIPLIAFGIPGNLAAALILGGFMMQGLTPGPLFMVKQGPLIYAIIIVLIISNFVNLTFGSVFLEIVRKVVYLPNNLIYPLVLFFSVIGCYVYRNNLFDLLVMFFLGIFGYILGKVGIPVLPLLIAFILGEMLERRIRQSLLISGGNYLTFINSPISLVFLLLSIILVVYAVRPKKKFTI